MSLESLNVDCVAKILTYLDYEDAKTLFDTSVTLAEKVFRANRGVPARMLTIRNANGFAEAIYHRSCRVNIYYRADLDTRFFAHAKFDSVNFVVVHPVELEEMLELFEKLLRWTHSGPHNAFRALNVYFMADAVPTEALLVHLEQFQFDNFICHSKYVPECVTLPRILRCCRRAHHILITAHTLLHDYMDALGEFKPVGDWPLLIGFHSATNPSIKTRVPEFFTIPPMQPFVAFCQKLSPRPFGLSVDICTDPEDPLPLALYVSELQAALPEMRINADGRHLCIANTNSMPVSLFAMNAQILSTPSRIFLDEFE